jgi:DNA-binding PadR family transcriptional regulator
MNPTRLFVLGALARHGPMYGHQIRRDARIDRTELWSEVRPGSLYGALHRMAAEGLIETVRTEQAGNLPARTVYAITAEGRKELLALRAEAFRQVGLRPDPVDLALAMSSDLAEEELRSLVEDRHRALAAQLQFFSHERERNWADQSVADTLILQHAIARLTAEIRWHEDLLAALPKLCAPASQTPVRQARAPEAPRGTAPRSAAARQAAPRSAAPPEAPAGQAAPRRATRGGQP